MKPKIPGTTRPTVEPPVCPNCAKVFLAAFHRVNKALPPDEQVSASELADRARYRARAVKLHGEWVCPRCTTLPTPDGNMVFVEKVYPNRKLRRAASQGRKGNKRTRKTPA